MTLRLHPHPRLPPLSDPIDVPVTEVPIVVDSTTDDYFVLYAKHEFGVESGDSISVDIPVSVTLGEAGTTTLSESLEPLPPESYRVEKYAVANPADIDGDGVDDITELNDMGVQNPLNGKKAIEMAHGAVAIPDHETFRALAHKGGPSDDPALSDLLLMKFVVRDLHTDAPSVYFINSVSIIGHQTFANNVDLDEVHPPPEDDDYHFLPGMLVYHPYVAAPDGTMGIYRFEVDQFEWDFHKVALVYESLGASMPALENNLVFYPPPDRMRPYYLRPPQKALYDASRVNVMLDEDIYGDLEFVPMNQQAGYGLLRSVSADDQPGPET